MRNLIVTVSALAFMSGLALAEARTLPSDEEAGHAAIDAFLNREDVSITSAESGATMRIKTENGWVTATAIAPSGQPVGGIHLSEQLHKLVFSDQASKNAAKNSIIAQIRHDSQIKNTVTEVAAVSGEKSQAQINRELQKGQAINLAISGIPDATNINRSFSFGTGVGYLNGETALAAGIHLRGGERVVAKAAVGSDLKFEAIGMTAGVSFAF